MKTGRPSWGSHRLAKVADRWVSCLAVQRQPPGRRGIPGHGSALDSSEILSDLPRLIPTYNPKEKPCPLFQVEEAINYEKDDTSCLIHTTLSDGYVL